MTYRDDRDADQARIAGLEAELAAARRQIDELEGRRSQALVLADRGALAAVQPRSRAVRWFGGPGRLELSARFDVAFPTERFEDLVERIREITREPGATELMRSSMTWRHDSSPQGMGPFIVITVVVRDGITTLTATDRLGQLAGALYGGLGGGLGGGGLAAPILASIAVPILTPVFVLGWLGSVFAGTRMLFRRAARRRAEALQRLFDAVAAEIERIARLEA
jgi:hypothetical protein